jgi:hypothetical protein
MKRAGGTHNLGGEQVNYIAGANPFNFTFNIDTQQGVGVDLDSARAGRQTSYSINYSLTTDNSTVVNGIEVRELAEASPLGAAYDRYFKYISEQVLKDYGAKLDLSADGEVQYNADRELLFTWAGAAPLTPDGAPLTTLDGEVITAAGYYDFTRRSATGDGAMFRYSEPDANGTRYIVGVDINFTDNQFGDNSVVLGTIVDPGVPVEVLPELGNGQATVYSGTGVYSILPNFFSNTLQSVERTRLDAKGVSETPGPGGGLELMGKGGSNGTGLMAMAIGGGGGAGAVGEIPAVLQQRLGQGEGDGEGDGNARGGNGLQANAGPGGLGAIERGEQQAPRVDRDRGTLLQPILDNLASATDQNKANSFVLSRLQEGSLMGNHLLDALAIGAGVAYGFYAPKAATVGQQGLRRLVGRVQRATGLGANAQAIQTQRVISVFSITLENGSQRLVAARVNGDGLTILAQQDLPEGTGVDTAGSQAQIDYSTKQLLERLRNSGIGQADQVLVDPRLQHQAGLMQGLGERTDLLVIRGLNQGLDTCTAEQRQQLQRWLQDPSRPLPDNSPLAELMQQRAASYARVMPANQASMATMVELGIAMAANPGNLV